MVEEKQIEIKIELYSFLDLFSSPEISEMES